jgi:hypothetical protein
MRGSAHVIIIICLVVALLGALGVVFYQNFIQNKQTTSNGSTSTSSKTDTSQTNGTTTTTLADGSIDSSFGTTLSFKYPSTWKYSQTMSGTIETDGTWTQKITLTSPSGKYVVQYYVGAGGGLGGTCVPTETGTIASTAYEGVSGFSGVSYTEMTYQNMPTEATNKIGIIELMDTAAASSVQAGASVCDTYLHEVVKLADKNYVQLIGATMTVSDATTSSQLKSALSGTEYEQGKAILLSTTH